MLHVRFVPRLWRPVSTIQLLVFGLASVVLSSGANCSAPEDRPWSVVTVRERKPNEVSFEDASGYLRPSRSANVVPGPDSLVARVHIENHRPQLKLHDLRTGDVTLLIEGNASLPRWSPDGRYVSCMVWKSQAQHGEFTVVEVASRSVIADPELRASGSWSKWSPDGSMIAVTGGIYGKPKQLLYTVAVPSGAVTVLDTLQLVAGYDFSWSPDSRWLAFTKPSRLDRMEEPEAADLWIAESASGRVWPLLATSEWIEANPLWTTNEALLVDRTSWDGSERGVTKSVVVELKRLE